MGVKEECKHLFKISMIEKDLSGNIISKSPVDKPNLLRGKEITLRIKVHQEPGINHKLKKETIPKPKKQTVKKETIPKTKNISKNN